MCHLTPAGEAELRRWLAEPVVRTREVRLEFLVKLYFARQLDPVLATRLADEQRAVMMQLAESLQEQLGQIPTAEAVDDATFRRLVLELRLQQTHAAADWLARVADMLRPAGAEAAGDRRKRHRRRRRRSSRRSGATAGTTDAVPSLDQETDRPPGDFPAADPLLLGLISQHSRCESERWANLDSCAPRLAAEIDVRRDCQRVVGAGTIFPEHRIGIGLRSASRAGLLQEASSLRTIVPTCSPRSAAARSSGLRPLMI